MSNENLVPPEIPSVAEMLRVTGGNTATFMEQVALHIEKLEAELHRMADRIKELENGTNSPTE